MTHERITLPYGRDRITVDVPSEKLLGVYSPSTLPPLADPAGALREALDQPLGALPLAERAKGASRVAIAIEDATRAVPNALLIDALMDRLTTAGVLPSQVTVLVATGLHRSMTDRELDGALGDWRGKLACENHDAHDSRRLARLGTTSLGTEISVNRTLLEADLKITTGDVEYHQFCGYGGGVKCVYPGLADEAAIQTNHSRMDLPGTGPGRLDGNPVREEIDEVGRLAGIDFNVSLALDAEHRIVAVSAGDPDRSFRSACRFIDQMYAVEVPGRADLVIASPGGHPKDIDLYQSQKAIEEATGLVTPDGNVLLTACCAEGSGSPRFEAWMDEAYTPDDIVRRIQENFVMGGHKAYQIARALRRANVYLRSEIAPGRVRSWMLNPLGSTADVDRLIARSESVIVLPQATLTLARLPSTDDDDNP